MGRWRKDSGGGALGFGGAVEALARTLQKPNNMLIVTSLLRLPPLPSCPGNAAPTDPCLSPPSCPGSATTVPTTQWHTHRYRHPTPPPTPRQHRSTPAAHSPTQQRLCATTVLTTPRHPLYFRVHFPLPSFPGPAPRRWGDWCIGGGCGGRHVATAR